MYSAYLTDAQQQAIANELLHDSYNGLGYVNITRMIKDELPELTPDQGGDVAVVAQQVSQLIKRAIQHATDQAAALIHAKSLRPGDAVIDLRDASQTIGYVTQAADLDSGGADNVTVRVAFSSIVDAPARYLRRA